LTVLNLGCGEDTYGDIRVDCYPTRTTTQVADLRSRLPFEDFTFDEVYSENLLEHLPNPGSFLREVSRVCKTGAKVTIITDNAGWWRYSLPMKLLARKESFETLHGCYRGIDPSDRHFSIFEPDHLKNHFEAAGLEVESIEYLAIRTKRRGGITSRAYYSTIEFITWANPLSKHLLYPQLHITGRKP
jgi:SAM-dependent methyltransferase